MPCITFYRVFCIMEIWKKILGYEDYEISNLGRVKSLERKKWMERNKSFATLKEKVLNPVVDKDGYLHVRLYKNKKGNTIKVHKLVAIYFLNHTPCGWGLVINHINFNKLDNRFFNLEIITARENTDKKHIEHTSEYTGVSWAKARKKWIAQIYINGKVKYLGSFNNEIDAHNAYQNKLLSLDL